MESYSEFINEAAKKKGGEDWYSGTDDMDNITRRNAYDGHYDDDDGYGDYDDDPGYDDYGYDEDYIGGGGDNWEDQEAERELGFKFTTDFKVGDRVIYKGRTNRTDQVGTVEKFRDDDKITVRFDTDKKLFAASRKYIRLAPEEEEFNRLKEAKKKELEEKRKSRPEVKDDVKDGDKWWERNKKS